MSRHLIVLIAIALLASCAQGAGTQSSSGASQPSGPSPAPSPSVYMAPHVLKASGGEAHWRTNPEQSSGPYGMDCYDGVHFCDGPVSAGRPWTAQDWRWLADELDAWYAGRGIEHLDGSEQRRIAELIESGDAAGTHFLDPDCWYEDRLNDCTARAPSSASGPPQATRTVNPASKTDPQPQTVGSRWCVEGTAEDCDAWVRLREPADVDRLTQDAWQTIALNYGECSGDTTGCVGLISGLEVWTSDDLRVVARALERLADFERQQGDEERADQHDGGAAYFYDWADDVDAGHRAPPSPGARSGRP